MRKKTMNKTTVNLVIGSEGFVGKPLCKFLENKGEKVIHFDIKRNKKEDARTAKLPLNKVDRVYFLAWDVGGAKYLYKSDTQLTQLNWNVDLLRNVMTQLQKSKTPFIFVSSQLAEKTDNVYAITKRLGEIWTRNLRGVCVRLWNMYGALEEINEKSHVIGDFVNQAISHGQIKMLTTGESKRQFIHINDVCEGLYFSMEKYLNDEIYDLTTFKWSTIKEVAQIIGKETKVKVIPGIQKKAPRSNIKSSSKLPGWKHKIYIKKGIKIMVNEAKKSK